MDESANIQEEEFKSEEFRNENFRSTFGSSNDARNAVVCEVVAAIELVRVSWAPSPQADLHESDESEVQLDCTQGVLAREMLGDAEKAPKIPDKIKVELPVQAPKLELTGLKNEKI
jgi:hypothetical protein